MKPRRVSPARVSALSEPWEGLTLSSPCAIGEPDVAPEIFFRDLEYSLTLVKTAFSFQKETMEISRDI